MKRYLIRGYTEKEIPQHTSPWEAIQEYFSKNDYLKLEPKLIFKQSENNVTVYIYKYKTLYYETFVVEERKY